MFQPGSVKIEFCTTKESDESKEPILSVSNPDPPLVRSESDKKSKLQVPTLCTSTLLSSCSITNKCGSDVPSTSQNATSESRHFCTNSAELLLYAWLDAALVGIATRLGRHSYPVRHSNLSSGSAGVRRKFSSSSCSSSSSITSVPPPAPETHSTLSGTPSISDSTPVDSAPDCSSSSKAAISVNTDISSAPLLSPGMNTCPLEATREAEAIETVKSLEIISKINSSDTSIDNSHTVCSDENPVKETAKIEMVVDQKQLIQISGATTNDKISLGSPTLSASENSTLQKSENILSHSHLAELQRRYSDILLSIGKSVGPRALAGPINLEEHTSTLMSSCSTTNKCASDVPSTSQIATSESRHFCTNSAELLLYGWLDVAFAGIATHLGRYLYPVRHLNLSSGSAGVRLHHPHLRLKSALFYTRLFFFFQGSSEDKTLRSGSSAGAYFWPSAISTGGSGCNASPFTSASHSTTPNIAPNIHDGFSLGSNWTTVSGDPKQVDADSVLAPSDTPLATSSKPLTSDIVGPTSLTNSALDPGAPSTHNMAVAAGSLDVSVDSNGSAVRTTTGWQRWCKHVYEASSPAQLHLLARALERGSRRAAQAGRGVPAAVAAYAARFPLPPLVCTACR
ncbi:unnamed protein product [Protopolystoma xenopodis]|uniref:Uncharacterized protein n=1 Tax=Protopolystoma xenopodis TaxID=117903 RepID=A0A3S5B0S6_9PLAT|nr:unnamed protein product [Protopolystoma xenopodis]